MQECRLVGVLHRHTGGLEMPIMRLNTALKLHRHTGGLEKHDKPIIAKFNLHRHTGGLEIRLIE